MGERAEQMAVARQHAHVEDVRWLHRWAEENPEGRVLQLGAGSGTMAVALFEGSSKISLWSVDIDKANLDWEEAALHGIDYWARYPTEGDSLDVAALPGWRGMADLLILDTSHTYEQTRAELTVWLPLMRRDIPVLVHDYDPVEETPVRHDGVKQAADEVLEGLGWEVAEQFGWSAVLRHTGTIKP